MSSTNNNPHLRDLTQLGSSGEDITIYCCLWREWRLSSFKGKKQGNMRRKRKETWATLMTVGGPAKRSPRTTCICGAKLMGAVIRRSPRLGETRHASTSLPCTYLLDVWHTSVCVLCCDSVLVFCVRGVGLQLSTHKKERVREWE